MKNKCKLLTTLLTVLAFLITLTYCTGDANTNNDESTALITDAATYDKATVNGVPISKFVIVHDGETLSKSIAREITEKLFESTGCTLQILDNTESECECEIIIGDVKRDIVGDFYQNNLANFNTYKIDIKGKKIAILASEQLSMRLAKDSFISLFASKDIVALTDANSYVGDVYENKAAVAIEKRINESDIRIAGNNIYFHQNNKNELYKNRKHDLLRSFALLDADVLMLQECGYSRSASPSKTTWHDEIDPELPSLGYTQVDVTLEGGAEENYTPIWYRAERLELVEAKYNLFDSTKYKPDTYLSNSKSYTSAVFKHKETGTVFACISTHFTWANDQNQAEQNEPSGGELRFSDAEEVKLEVLALREKYSADLPIVLMGDFNTSDGTGPCNLIKSIMTNARFVEGIKKNNVDYSTTHNLGSKPGRGNSIDFTFISGKGFSPLQYQHVVNKWALSSTDHVPLLLDVSFNSQ